MIEWAVAAGAVFRLVMLALIDVLPRAFTGDEAVVDRAKDLAAVRSCSPPTARSSRLDGI